MTRYSIKDLEHLSGIKAHTIRVWEKRYQLLDPGRSNTNIRFYSDQDVRKILNVAMLVKSGYKISNVAVFDDSKLQAEVLRQNRNLPDPDKNTDQLLIYTINLDSLGFEQLLKKIIQENGFSKTIQNVVFPFFERIGILWQAGTIFVAHEHFVSSLIRNFLIVETSKFDNRQSEKTILFFLPENEMHELGLLFCNFLAAEIGYKCVYLGQDVPFEDLVKLMASVDFKYICTSFVNAVEKSQLELYISKLAKVFVNSKILLGGRQIVNNKLKLPINVSVIKNTNDFVKKISV